MDELSGMISHTSCTISLTRFLHSCCVSYGPRVSSNVIHSAVVIKEHINIDASNMLSLYKKEGRNSTLAKSRPVVPLSGYSEPRRNKYSIKSCWQVGLDPIVRQHVLSNQRFFNILNAKGLTGTFF
jgi:hypothetical protein